MAQPNSDSNIVSVPAQPGQPYDAVDGNDSTRPWVKLPGGAASINTGRLQNGGGSDNWPSDGVFKQV